MGNHQAGRAMGKTAEAMLRMRTDQTALMLLDMICFPYEGCDAEFEAEDPNNPGHMHPDYVFYTDPDGPMGKLIIEAFGEPGKDYIGAWGEEEQNAWLNTGVRIEKEKIEMGTNPLG